MLQNDRQIAISAAGSRNAAKWPVQKLYLSELYERLHTPARGTETLDEYIKLKKPQQDALKDVGGFVGGIVHNGGRRKGNAIDGRDILTLDLDHIPTEGTQSVLQRVDSLGCGYCIYSTRKHRPDAPRLRIIIPLDRGITADEYEPIARKAAEMIGIEMCDPSTFEASRLMYWPSCCSDSQYVYTYGDKPFLSANGMLELYTDWHDFTAWPQVPGVTDTRRRLAQRQEDPTKKPGVVGAFCRIYNVYSAMDKFLPGVYEPVDNAPDRYTYTAGSTTGGAIVYEDGAFLFSHHATDPAGGRLVNAFDLVRLHLFGDKDDEALPGTPTNRLPSYTAMCERACSDPDVSALMSHERYTEATKQFESIPLDASESEPENWMQKLQKNPQTGAITKTIDNIWLILENDPLIKGKIMLNEFASRAEVFGPLPWNACKTRRPWEDSDNDGAYWYLEKVYNLSGTGKIDSALALHGKKHTFNEIKEYMQSLSWDGTPRLDTLFIDYLGAEDNLYTRAVTRKAFTAAVARAMVPGTKFDNMTVISGKQGIGKSTLLCKMARGWFTDGLRTFEGKEAYEIIQGKLIVEIGELEAFRRADINRVKQFLSQRTDRFRAAYAKNVQECPRCCVFFGTTNNAEYLQDRTGNRRFWPIDTGIRQPTKSVFKDLDQDIDQLWAEAYMRWQLGEPLYLDQDIDTFAKDEQEEHREHSPFEGIIIDFLQQKVPEDWNRWDVIRRNMFWQQEDKENTALVDRQRVCALEVWCEALERDKRDMRRSDAFEINGIISMQPDWKRMKKVAKFGPYKVQRGFEKTG